MGHSLRVILRRVPAVVAALCASAVSAASIEFNREIRPILAVAALRERIAPLVQISEVRTVAADDLWMSPCYQQASVGIHFTWKKDWPAVREVLPLIERELAEFSARPHWAKLFTMTPEQLQPLYPKLADFRDLLLSTDPHGKFRNAFVDRNIF